MNPRLSIAEPLSFVMQPAAMVQRRFDLYKRMGVGTLRAGLGWWNQEVSSGVWQGSNRLPYYKQAVQNGFRLKMQIGTISAPARWYMAQNPGARLLNHDYTPSTSDISFWYPDLHAIMAAKGEHLFSYLADQKLFDSVDYIFVDGGPAGEPIYPADWTLPTGATSANASFWFYDNNAQASFAPAMSALYSGGLDDANRAWGTSFKAWRDVKIPEPGTRPGAMWNDVLTWYRDTKRSFVAWQVANYQTLLRRYAGSAMPKLVLMVPGSHIASAEWLNAVSRGEGDYGVKIMCDSEYLLDLAAQTGCWLQYTGVENAAEVAYLQSYMQQKGRNVPMWGENAGTPEVANDPLKVSDVVVRNKLWGFEYISAEYIFDKEGVNPTQVFSKLASAYSLISRTAR